MEGKNDHRKYFMMNVLDPAGSNLGPPDHQSDVHPTEPLGPAMGLQFAEINLGTCAPSDDSDQPMLTP